MGKSISTLEEEAILEGLDAGLPLRQIAKQCNRSASTISRVAKRNNIDVVRTQTKKASEAAHAFGLIRRLTTNNKAFIKFESLLDECDNATDFKNLAIAYGIITDKRLMEASDEGGQRGGEIGELLEAIKEGEG